MAMTRRAFLRTAFAGAFAAGLGKRAAAQGGARPNVLLICVDDLRPQLPCYGKTFMKTPHLDRFAESAAVFNRHYVAVPTCGPSRACLLTGRYPQDDAWYSNRVFDGLPRDEAFAKSTLPGAFRAAGYTTVSVGKVSDNPGGRRHAKPSDKFDDEGQMLRTGPNDGEPELAHAWDRVGMPTGEWGDPWSAFFGYEGGETRRYQPPKSPATEAADVPDTGYPDGLIAEEAIAELRRLKEEPFLLAVGFYKPHLPFCAPKKYWDLYDPEALPLPPHPAPPATVDTSISLHTNGELNNNYQALANPHEATEAEARHLRHGYFACVSYVDAQIGKVLDELERLGLADNTLVVVWGDHGWHLGDLHVWGKHTTFDWSLHSALLIRAPGMKAPGGHVDGIVESVDIFPTLADYCGVAMPHELAGASMRPLLDDPDAPGKEHAPGFWRRGNLNAVTLRTARYRYTQWTSRNGHVAQEELYDHDTAPGETINIAQDKPEVVLHFRGLLDRYPQARRGT
jgi:arylsulfatase A-like enzyme